MDDRFRHINFIINLNDSRSFFFIFLRLVSTRMWAIGISESLQSLCGEELKTFAVEKLKLILELDACLSEI